MMTDGEIQEKIEKLDETELDSLIAEFRKKNPKNSKMTWNGEYTSRFIKFLRRYHHDDILYDPDERKEILPLQLNRQVIDALIGNKENRSEYIQTIFNEFFARYGPILDQFSTEKVDEHGEPYKKNITLSISKQMRRRLDELHNEKEIFFSRSELMRFIIMHTYLIREYGKLAKFDEKARKLRRHPEFIELMDELLDNEKTTRTPTSTPKLNTPGE